ncbi:MAG TPA: hypothetical protein VGM84_08830 [Steroidobacteraceae bacterium]|jgi:hypothetical protein
MDLQQLQLLAGRARDLLQQSNHAIGHNQSLDLIAALPGLRNWPEVRAFPDRVAACQLDASSAGRLAFRVNKKFALDLSAPDILAALSGADAIGPSLVPEVWPSGPVPGVYVTTSQNAINALLVRYEEETDGAVVYAERAGNHWDGSIDLGEGGLWSPGLSRIASGTLLVIGPLAFNQQNWSDCASRLEMACLHVQNTGHRVAALIQSPTPEDICEDTDLMVRSLQAAGDDCETALRGLVTESGELLPRRPFARPRRSVRRLPSIATTEAIPRAAIEALRRALQGRKSGLLMFGGEAVRGHWAADLVDAALALTEHAGPAARIVPRDRSTPEKNWWVPEATKQLPFVPSVQSAYDRGYRRMLIDPHSTDDEILKTFARDVLFIAGTHGFEAQTIVFGGIRMLGHGSQDADILRQIIGLLGVVRIPTPTGVVAISDVFLGPANLPDAARIKDIAEYVTHNRAVLWEEQLEQALTDGALTRDDLENLARSEGTSMMSRYAEQIIEKLHEEH